MMKYGNTYTSSNGIAQARAQDRFNDAIKLGLSDEEANRTFFWAYRQTMQQRGF